MFRGGYKVIDLQDKSITSQGVTVEGVYDAIENSNRYALQLCNVVVDGVEKNDAFVTVKVDASNYLIDAYGVKIQVTSEDVISLVE